MAADSLQQKALAAAVFSNNKSEGSPALADDLHITEEGVNLCHTANGYIGQAGPGDNSAFKRIDDRRGDPFGICMVSSFLSQAEKRFELLCVILYDLGIFPIELDNGISEAVEELLVYAVRKK